MDTHTTGRSVVDPLLLFGSTTRLDDALLFVEIKEQDGWRVILRPFPFAFTNISLQSPTGVVTSKVASEFAFLLHRFFPQCTLGGMNKRKVTLTFEIPAWVPPWREFVRWYKTVRFAILPFRCSVTGKRLQFKNASYEYNHGGGRVMVSTWGKPLCREELIKYISRHFTDPTLQQGYSRTLETRKCDSCGHVKPTISSGEKMNFGMQWWNGFHLCELCLTETVRLGKAKSSVFAYANGKSVCVNEAGVYVTPVTPVGTTKVEICSEKAKLSW